MTTVSGFCGGNSRAADRAGLRSRSGARKNGAIITLVQRSEWSPFGRGARLKKREDRNARVGLRGVGEHSEGRNSISGSADDKVRVPHPVPKPTA